MEKLEKRDKNIDIDKKVQQNKAQNANNRLGTLFNLKMFSRVTTPVEVDEDLRDCVWVEDEKPTKLVRTTSVQVLPAPKFTDRPVRASSEVFSDEIVNALKKRFANVRCNEEDSEDWSNEELDVN